MEVQATMIAVPLSTDAFPPDLMAELRAVRAPFRDAYGILWRRERAFRFVYWLEHREHPPFNLIGSWTQPDMLAEMALWAKLRLACLDTADVIDTVTDILEQRFGLSYPSLIERASHPSLAGYGLPIWNQATDSLIPQCLSHWRIRGVTDHESPGTGLSYAFDHPDVVSSLTLYIYDRCLRDLTPGLSDPRFAAEVAQCVAEINAFADWAGNEITWYIPPVRELTHSRSGTEVPFGTTTWLIVQPDGTRLIGALSMTVFRGHFLKVRCTTTEEYGNSDECQAAFKDLTYDLADFVELFGP